MKKLQTVCTIVLCICLLSACKPRIDTPTPEVSPADLIELPEQAPEELLEPANPTKHSISDPEQIAEITSIVSGLLQRAQTADAVYRGAIPIFTEEPPQVLGEDNYYPVKADFKTMGQLEDFWFSTFTPNNIAVARYEEMQNSHLYASINGALYVKQAQPPAPLTVGEWDIDTLRIVRVEEEEIVVEMDTTLVGQPNGTQRLELIKQEQFWLLTDSYFLEHA